MPCGMVFEGTTRAVTSFPSRTSQAWLAAITMLELFGRMKTLRAWARFDRFEEILGRGIHRLAARDDSTPSSLNISSSPAPAETATIA
jgi:hypothetical protein